MDLTRSWLGAVAAWMSVTPQQPDAFAPAASSTPQEPPVPSLAGGSPATIVTRSGLTRRPRSSQGATAAARRENKDSH